MTDQHVADLNERNQLGTLLVSERHRPKKSTTDRKITPSQMMENTKNAALPEAIDDRWCVPQASDDLIFSSHPVAAGLFCLSDI